MAVARSGRRSCGSHHNRRFLRRARFDGYPNLDKSLKQVQTRSDEQLPRKGGAGGLVANTVPGLRQSPVQRGEPRGHAQLSWTQRSRGGTPPDRRAREIGPHFLTLGLPVNDCRGRRKISRLQEQLEIAATEDPKIQRYEAPHGLLPRAGGGFLPTVSLVT